MSNEEKCRFCEQPKERIPFGISAMTIFIFATISYVAVLRDSGKSQLIGVAVSVFMIFVISLLYYTQNVRHRSLSWFKDLDDPAIAHHHKRQPDRVGNGYRDHANRVIQGPILVQPVSGWGNKVRVLNADPLARVKVIDSSYPSFWDSSVTLVSDNLELKCPQHRALEWLDEGINLYEHFDRSRKYKERDERAVELETKLLKQNILLGITGSMLAGIKKFLLEFPRRSEAAKQGRERIDVVLDDIRQENPDKLKDWERQSETTLRWAEAALQRKKEEATTVTTT